VTVTVAVADTDGLTVLVTLTVNVPFVLPAVKRPVGEIWLPFPVTLQVTCCAGRPENVAANCRVPPAPTLALAGSTCRPRMTNAG
jgi:hypothetical protein